MDVRSRVLALVLALIIVGLSASHSLARSVRFGEVPTVEWLAADAEVVVRARIIEISARPEGRWVSASARSIETLKGTVGEQFDFAVRSEPKLLNSYRGREVLLFLREKARHSFQETDPSPCSLVLPHLTAEWAVVGLDGNHDDFAVSMDFAVIEIPALIIQAALAAITRRAGRPRPKSYRIIMVPWKSEVSERVSGFNSRGLTVPLDEHLEAKAIDWIKSTNPYIRLAGVEALSRFRSDANIARLKALLSDTDCEGGRYIIRTCAFNVLSGWGIECGTPVLELPSPIRKPLGQMILSERLSAT